MGDPGEERSDGPGPDTGAAGAGRPPVEVNSRQVMAFMARLLLAHPWPLAGAFALGLGLVAAEYLGLSLLVPFMTSLGLSAPSAVLGRVGLPALTEWIGGFGTLDQIRLIVVVLVAVQLVKGALSYAAGRVAAYMEAQVEQDLRDRLYSQALDVDLAFLRSRRIGQLYAILHRYPEHTSKVSTKFLSAIPKAARLLAYVAFLITIDWRLTVLGFAIVALGTFVVSGLVSVVKRGARRINVARETQNQITLETLQAMKLVRLFQRQHRERERFRTGLRDLKTQQYRKGTIESLVPAIHATLNVALMGAVIVTATFVLDTSTQGWPFLLAGFLLVMTRVMAPAGSLLKRRLAIANALPTVQVILEFLDRSDKPFMPDGARDCSGLRQGVRFEHVSFRYRRDLEEVITDVTFDIPRGSFVAVVGGSGAGKSTLVNLLARLDDPTQGRVLVDGVDLRAYRIASWRRRIAVVSQETFLFNASVRDNIRYGRLDASDADVEAAARAAGAHGFILALEDGYATTVGDRGTRLSGGQAQRIAIARAVLADPELLVLDEATSALDTDTERQVQEALDRLSRDRTVLAIAHRLSTVWRADLILVLEHGRIVERGTHAELMARKGRYFRYVGLQGMDDGGARAAGAAPSGAASARAGRGVDGSHVELDVTGLEAIVWRDGGVLTVAPVLDVEPGDDPVAALQAAPGSAVVIAPGRRTAWVRVGDVVLGEVPVGETPSSM